MNLFDVAGFVLDSSSSDEDELPPVISENKFGVSDYVRVMLNNVIILAQRVSLVRVTNYVETTRRYTDVQFISHFRLSRGTAYDLIRDFENSNTFQNHINYAGKEEISGERHILIFLWFAGHTASYRDVADRFDVSLSTLFHVIKRVTDFLLHIAANIIQMPNVQEKEVIEGAFRRQKNFPGVLGAVDGSHIQIDRPVEDPNSYCNRKRYFSIHLQGLVDHRNKFLHVVVGYPGSVHDARVFRESGLPEELEALCDAGEYILGDSAYPCLPVLLTPFKDDGHLTQAQKQFNKRLSSCRIVVEHAFGNLKQRFRQLYHLHLRDIERSVKFIHACCVLHNIAKEDDLQFLEPREVEEHVGNGVAGQYVIVPNNTGPTLRDEICRQFAAGTQFY